MGRVRIAGWSGAVTVRQVYLLKARLANVDVFATVDVEAELCVLGRDILNDFELLMSATHKSIVIREPQHDVPSWEAARNCQCTDKCTDHCDAHGWWSNSVVADNTEDINQVLWYTVVVQGAALVGIIVAPRLSIGYGSSLKKLL